MDCGSGFALARPRVVFTYEGEGHARSGNGSARWNHLANPKNFFFFFSSSVRRSFPKSRLLATSPQDTSPMYGQIPPHHPQRNNPQEWWWWWWWQYSEEACRMFGRFLIASYKSEYPSSSEDWYSHLFFIFLYILLFFLRGKTHHRPSCHLHRILFFSLWGLLRGGLTAQVFSLSSWLSSFIYRVWPWLPYRERVEDSGSKSGRAAGA